MAKDQFYETEGPGDQRRASSVPLGRPDCHREREVNIIGEILGVVQLPSLEAVIDYSVRRCGLHEETLRNRGVVLKLRDDFVVQHVGNNGISPTLELAKRAGLIDAFDRLQGLELCREIVKRYLKSVGYLFPIFEDFSTLLDAVCRKQGLEHVIFFLRDSIFQIPGMMRRGWSTEQLGVCFLNKKILAQLREGKNGSSDDVDLFLPTVAFPHRTCFVDVGAYGTLMDYLLEKGRISTTSYVVNLISRNPNLFSWCKVRGKNYPEIKSLNLLDSIESLIKPMPLYGLNEKGRITEESGDVASTILANALVWALYHLPEVSRTSEKRNRWYLDPPIPAWKGRTEFVKSWKHGPLLPLGEGM